MKKQTLLIISSLSIVKLIIHLVGNQNYGFHRDELLHLSVSEHLDWGFMEFPPFIGLLGKMSYCLFNYSLSGVRLFPTLAGVGILILCTLIAKELGGKSKAILLAGVSILAFLPFYRNHTLFQPVAFDQLFWTWGFYYVIRFINTKDKQYLLSMGAILGIGLMNKYTIIIWAFGLFIGLFFYKRGSLYKNKWLYLSACLSLFIFLPNIIWQLENGIPFLRHLQELNESQLDDLSPFSFGLVQLSYPYTLTISVVGLIVLLAGRNLKKYRAIGISALVIFCTMWILKSKAYYVFALYPVLFAAGAVKIESILASRPKWVYAITAILFITAIPFIPESTPVLSIEKFINYTGIKEVNGRVELTGDYADMFGWEEQVRLVDSVYQSLSKEEQNNCVLWAENYGEAGALKILGRKYNLSNPICLHGSFWVWGFDNKDAAVWITLGNEQPMVEYVFEDIKLVKMITHKYAIGEEHNIPIYVCRKPKIDIEQMWIDSEEYMFD